MKQLIGTVTLAERDEIQSLFERKSSLIELAKSISSEDPIYERLISDMSITTSKYQLWWENMSSKYGWEKLDDSNWRINFNTCEIFLIQNK
mgnify:CR=1 FL=1